MKQEQSIKILKEIEHIRLRPGVYTGDVATPKNMIRELVDNSLDECLNGWSSILDITTGEDSEGHWCEVYDEGRGLPQYVIKDEDNDDIAAKLLFTKLFSGGKFSHDNYEISAGLHGMGLTVVNALSKKLVIETFNGTSVYVMEFSKGILISELQTPVNMNVLIGGHSCTKIRVYPDPLIFTSTKPAIDLESLKIAKNALPKVIISFNQTEIQALSFKTTFSNQMLLAEPIKFEYVPKTLTEKNKGFKYIVEFNWDKVEYDFRWVSSVNLVVVNNGYHIRESKKIIGECLNQINPSFKIDDYSIGLRCIIYAFLPDPQFTSQSKENLSGSEAFALEKSLIIGQLKDSLVSYDLSSIYNKILMYKEAMNKLSLDEFIKTKIKKGSGTSPLKNLGNIVFECTSNDRSNTEMLICEGKCFSEDTEILDVNFNKIRLDDLSKKITPTYTFSCSDKGHVSVSKVLKCWKAKSCNELAEVLLDNDKRIKCTTDHKFMLRDGSYKMAKDLKENDSLMPLYYDTSNDRNLIQTNFISKNHNKGRWTPVYEVSSNHIDTKQEIVSELTVQIHHIDHNKKNDYPTNLKIMNESNHLKIHSYKPSTEEWKILHKLGSEGLLNKRKDSEYNKTYLENLRKSTNTLEFKENARILAINRMKDPKTRLHLSKVASIQWNDPKLIKWRSEETKKYAKDHPEEMNKRRKQMTVSQVKYTIDCIKSKNLPLSKDTYDEVRLSISSKYPKYDTAIYYCPDLFNHKVLEVKILTLDHEIDFYDVEVDSEYHNFSLAAGVFVHNSAGGGLVATRNRVYQAILPLRGKILNVSTSDDLQRILNNVEIKNIVNAIGIGIKPHEDIECRRYERIIFLPDADPDGLNIAALLLGAIAYLTPTLIETGHVYIIRAPLYFQNGKFLTDDSTLDKRKSFKRFKGLGEMNNTELYEIALNQETRKLEKLTITSLSEIYSIVTLVGTSSTKKKLMIERNLL